MKESSRVAAIKTYSRHVLFYALRAMWRALQAGESHAHLFQRHRRTVASIFDSTSTIVLTRDARKAVDEWYGFARQIIETELHRTPLEEDIPSKLASVPSLLQYLVVLQSSFAESVLQSKRKDDTRGSRIIDDYRSAHPAAETDAVVKSAMEAAKQLRMDIEGYLGQLRPAPLANDACNTGSTNRSPPSISAAHSLTARL